MLALGLSVWDRVQAGFWAGFWAIEISPVLLERVYGEVDDVVEMTQAQT